MATALQKYKEGKSLAPSERGQALKAAVAQSDAARSKTALSSARMKRAAGSAGRTLGTVGVGSASAYASGRYGEKMKPGGYDVRPLVGVLALGLGLYQESKGGKGGTVAAAVGDGLLTSYTVEMALDAGRKAAATAAASADPNKVEKTEGDVGADELPPVRRILYSPEPVSGPGSAPGMVPAHVLNPLSI